MGIFLLFSPKNKTMRKIILSLATIAVLASCNEKKSDKNLVITGNIKGLKKGTLYIQHIENDSVLKVLDSIKIDGDSNFKSELNISSPEMYFLSLDRGVTNSVDNNLTFFAEPGEINITSSLEFFTFDAKITGSKSEDLYQEYKKIATQFTDKSLDLVQQKFEALKNKDAAKLAQLATAQDQNTKKRYLYTTNFAVNHGDSEVAPYITIAEISDINIKYLDTIQKRMTPKVAQSNYGKKLIQIIEERKKLKSSE